MKTIDVDVLRNYTHDVILANGAKHRCIDATVIHEIPTIDAEPVRHGVWEQGMRCPYCGQIDLAKPNYCCNCGAKMDAEVNGDA